MKNGRWIVDVNRRTKPGEPIDAIGQVYVDPASGVVTEAWTGHQVAWTMARGYPGAFGRSVNSPWIWVTLCVLFIAAVRERAPPAVLAARRSARAARLQRLAGVLQRREPRAVRPAHAPAAGLPAGAAAVDRARARRARAAGAADQRPVAVAGGRDAVPDRLSRRPQRRRRQRHRRRLLGRDRRRQADPWPRAVGRVPERQRARRHLRAAAVPGLRPVRADLAVGRALGQPRRRARRRRDLRPGVHRAAVPDRPPPLGPAAGRRVGLCLGHVPVHDLRDQRRDQRRAAGGARARRAAGARAPAAPRRAGRRPRA